LQGPARALTQRSAARKARAATHSPLWLFWGFIGCRSRPNSAKATSRFSRSGGDTSAKFQNSNVFRVFGKQSQKAILGASRNHNWIQHVQVLLFVFGPPPCLSSLQGQQRKASTQAHIFAECFLWASDAIANANNTQCDGVLGGRLLQLRPRAKLHVWALMLRCDGLQPLVHAKMPHVALRASSCGPSVSKRQLQRSSYTPVRAKEMR